MGLNKTLPLKAAKDCARRPALRAAAERYEQGAGAWRADH